MHINDLTNQANYLAFFESCTYELEVCLLLLIDFSHYYPVFIDFTLCNINAKCVLGIRSLRTGSYLAFINEIKCYYAPLLWQNNKQTFHFILFLVVNRVHCINMHSYLGDRHYSFISAACVHLAGTLMMAVSFQKKISLLEWMHHVL